MQHSIKHRASTAHPDEDDLVDTTCTHKNLLTERCEINRIPATGRSCAPSEERKLLLPSTSQGFLPAVDLSDGGPFTASRDSCPGADAKFFAGFMAKNFVAGASHPGQMEREGVTSAPGKSTAGNRPQRWRQEGGLLRHQAQFPHTPSGVQGAQVTARQGRRDRNGRCKPGFHASDRSGSPKPRQRVRRRLAGAPAAACRSRA